MGSVSFGRWFRLGAAIGMTMLAVACGDDTTSGTVKVTGADYSFKNLPKEAEAGTVLSLTNESSKEVHELVALKLPDSEKRSAEDLVKLPQDQLEGLFRGPPTAVLVAPPSGAPQIQAVGDGRLSEKGRYLIMCSIPIGADPAAYLAAAQRGGDGPPSVAGGPPHFTQGMYGEVKVV